VLRSLHLLLESGSGWTISETCSHSIGCDLKVNCVKGIDKLEFAEVSWIVE
jgi:hypothetical protein